MSDSTRSLILDIASGESLEFQNGPKDVKEKKSAVVTSRKIPGLSHPRKVSSAGGDHTIRFTLTYYAEDNQTRTPEWVMQQINWIMSLLYVREIDGTEGSHAITPVFLILGDLLQLPVLLMSADATWSEFRDVDMRPVAAKIALDFVEYVDPGGLINAIAARQGKARLRRWQTKETREIRDAEVTFAIDSLFFRSEL